MTFCQVENPKAITTWSGFVYQGKIALLASLRYLFNDFEHAKNYKLQIEKLDDFSVHDDDNRIISIHQVKCKKASTQGAYTDAINSLIAKKNGATSVQCYLHVSTKLASFTDGSINLYSYGGNTFLPISSVEDEMQDLLKKIITTHFSTLRFADNDIHILSLCLDNLLVGVVASAHSENQEQNIDLTLVKRELLFSQFIDLIQNYQYGAQYSEQFFIDSLKSHFGLLANLFKVDFDIDANGSKHLDVVIGKVFNLENSQFNSFLKIINPEWEGSSVTSVGQLLKAKPTGFNVPFLYFIAKSFSVGDFNITKARYEVSNGSELFIPYAYADTLGMTQEQYVNKIVESMFKSNESAQLFYEGDILVSHTHNIDGLIESYSANYAGIPPYSGEGKNCTEPKNIRIVDYKKALQLLGINND